MGVPGSDAGDAAGGVVALAVIAHHSAEDLVDGKAEDFATNVPQGHVEGANGVGLFTSRGIEEGAVHILPQPLDVLRVAADETASGLGERVLGAAFADAGDASVGLHCDHHVALVEERVWIRRQICANPRDLHSWQGGEGRQRRCCGSKHSGRKGLEEGSPLHGQGLLFQSRMVSPGMGG